MLKPHLLKVFFTALIISFVLPSVLFAQLERQRVQTDGPVELTFMAPKNVNLYNTMALEQGVLHYSIMHTFGEINQGPRNLWGIDSGANVRFSFEYGITDRISAGIGRSSLDMIVDTFAKYSVFKQTRSGSVPVSVSLVPTLGINTSDPNFFKDEYSFSDRLNFGLSVPVSRKFNDELSLQVSPIIVHFNRVGSRVGSDIGVVDQTVNTYYTVGLSGRYKIRPQTAVSIQYLPPLTQADNLDHNVAIGLDIETGGHVFQLFFTTSQALNDQYLVAGNNGSFMDREFRFGFNINRLFQLGR